MLLTDYFTSSKNITWEFAKQTGVDNGVIRLPETEGFDVTDHSHWESVVKGFTDFGIKPVVIEPMPNCLHDHIKAGEGKDCAGGVLLLCSEAGRYITGTDLVIDGGIHL